jgi:hypothetical protein
MMLEKPITVYLNWSSYDELSDTVELTEALALQQLDELLRLRKLGVRLDYYVMDAFWFAKDGGYREWRKPHWPSGPDRWLERCISNDVKPGLWFGANNPAWMNPIPAWMDSFDPETGCMCCFYGGFLPHYIETLHLWYEQGIRLFKFDFADFNAAPPGIKQALSPYEIRTANMTAFRGALKAFRSAHPDAILIAYNGFEEQSIQHATDEPQAKVLDTRWLEVFDSIYCGDPRPADVPTMNFWRSKDIYSDHMVRRYEQNDIPLRRIDNAGFMIGTTGTCYYRGSAAWRGMLILSLARGGRINTYYGNLELLNDEDAGWFSQVQRLFLDIQQYGTIDTFGEMPGAGGVYGFTSTDAHGALITLVNSSQKTQTLRLPRADTPTLLFTDVGYRPHIAGNHITLGPEQMALLGYGRYAVVTLGTEKDVVIPESINRLDIQFTAKGERSICAEAVSLSGESNGKLRIVFQQLDSQGRSVRISGGNPPQGKTLGQLLTITAEQGGQTLPIQINYDKAIWSGLSWAVGEISINDFTQPITLCCHSQDKREVTLSAAVYWVTYEAQ